MLPSPGVLLNQAMRINQAPGEPEAGPAGIPRPDCSVSTHKTLKNLPRSTRHMQTSSVFSGPHRPLLTLDESFYPAQLNNAAKALDKSKDKRAFSEGTALMQDLTGPAKQVMPSSIPDSGTAGRTLANILNPINWPGMAVSGAASIPVSMMYSKPGMQAINTLYNREGSAGQCATGVAGEQPSNAPGVPVSGETWAI